MVRNSRDSKKNYCYIRDRLDSDYNISKISIAKEKIKQQDLNRYIFNLPYTRTFTFFLNPISIDLFGALWYWGGAQCAPRY